MSSFLKDSIIGLLFTAVVLTIHMFINDQICSCQQFDFWGLTYGSQFGIYLILFLTLNYVNKVNKKYLGMVFLAIATFRIIFVAGVLLIVKKYFDIDIRPFTFHFVSIALIFIVFETIRVYRRFLSF